MRGRTHGRRPASIAARLAPALLAASAILALALGGCSKSEQPLKVAVIGIDGMDWQLADPLMEAGRMPNVKRIVDAGMRADLRSLGEGEKSPSIWASIATGKVPAKHGVLDFVMDGEEKRLVGSMTWRARPIWDLLGENGHTVGVVNWLVTWPAFQVNGYIVADRVAFAPEDGHEPVLELTWPPELADEFGPLRKPATQTDNDEIAGFFNGTAWRTTTSRDIGLAVEAFRMTWAGDQTVLTVAEHLLDTREQPDFFAVYFEGLDLNCHRHWGQMDPSSVDLMQSEEFVETFRDVIPRYYERMDRIVGEIVEHLDEDTTVIICSDHGFRGPVRTPQGILLGVLMHRQVGVFAAAGPRIRKGGRPADLHVMDIAPTLLALFGLPVGRDMDGFVAEEVIDPRFIERHPVAFVDTRERPGGETTGGQEASPVDDAVKERLRSVGYIE